MKKKATIGLILGTAATIIIATYFIFIRKPKKDAEIKNNDTGELGGDTDSNKTTGNTSTGTSNSSSSNSSHLKLLKKGYGTVSVSSSLNVREEPNTSSRIVTKLPSGESVKLLSYSNGWFGIRLYPIVGNVYVSAKYIK
jgi:uncharacterized protein YgiM (DUF1202 family)